MKNVIQILALVLILFALILCYGLGMYCMYVAGWVKSFYLSIASIAALFALSAYVRYDINKTIGKK